MTASVSALRRQLVGRQRVTLELPDACPAAVLVPVVVRGGEPLLVFTQRSVELKSHSGQISFPGGKCDASDRDRAATAIREANEELGIEPAGVEVLGMLDDLGTPTGFLITPVVALLHPAPELYRPNPAEVAEVFEVSLAHLRDPTAFDDRWVIEHRGQQFTTCAYRVGRRDIWGATGRIVQQLLALL